MIVDTDGSSCVTVNFGLGTDSSTSRQWDIMVSSLYRIKSYKSLLLYSDINTFINISMIFTDYSI